MNKTKVVLLAASFLFAMVFTSCASSKATEAIKSASSIDEVVGLKNKLTWLKSNAQSGGSYTIELNSDASSGGSCGGFLTQCSDLSYKDRDNITITLKGIGTNRTITKGEQGSVFIVGVGVTLVLDDNITIKGPPGVGAMEAAKTNSLIYVSSGGTLIMNDGSTITDNINLSGLGGGGVYVYHEGTFIMKGGNITRTMCFQVPDPGLAAASKGKYDAFAKIDRKGGGVYVSGKGSLFGKELLSGTFTKTGGTITGHASDPENGNVIKDFGGNKAVPNSGHAIYFSGNKDNESKAIDTTVGPEISLHFSNGKLSENYVAAPVVQIPEPVNETANQNSEPVTESDESVSESDDESVEQNYEPKEP